MSSLFSMRPNFTDTSCLNIVPIIDSYPLKARATRSPGFCSQMPSVESARMALRKTAGSAPRSNMRWTAFPMSAKSS